MKALFAGNAGAPAGQRLPNAQAFRLLSTLQNMNSFDTVFQTAYAGESPAFPAKSAFDLETARFAVKSFLIMFLVIGTKFFTWGAEKTPDMIRCSECGTVAQFTEKTGMRFLTFFFIVPTIPLSGTKKMIECPNCKARFQTE